MNFYGSSNVVVPDFTYIMPAELMKLYMEHSVIMFRGKYCRVTFNYDMMVDHFTTGDMWLMGKDIAVIETKL